MKMKKIHKILVGENEDIGNVKERLRGEKVVLESGSFFRNQRTFHITQILCTKHGWKFEKAKFYKGKRFKVILSKSGSEEAKAEVSKNAEPELPVMEVAKMRGQAPKGGAVQVPVK
ncbi:MAG: hypothetical protein A7316_00400 [Candidatus Altiarchaeales archaeon WOR_SM1_86-2]|nr:MAG: hypothetical protein A7316_00400 [Candidatus Altiarchaeales archaeon WOR_SM1_86-2]